LAEELGLELLSLKSKVPYLGEAVETFRLLKGYDLVFVQVPQGALLWLASLLKSRGFKLVADIHSGFILLDSPKLKLLNWPFRGTILKSDLILVHNSEIVKLLPDSVKDKVIVVYDPPLRGVKWEGGGGYAVIPAGGYGDEDIRPIIKAIAKSGVLKEVHLTGPGKPLITHINGVKIVRTGFLEWNRYLDELKKADLLIAITQREYTFLRSAWEALCIGAPFVISDTRTLRSIYKELPEWAFLKRHVEHIITSMTILKSRYEELLKGVEAARSRLLSEAEKQLRYLKEKISD